MVFLMRQPKLGRGLEHNALAADDTFLKRQGVEDERCCVIGLAYLAEGGNRVGLCPGRGPAERRMHVVVVRTERFQGQVPLETGERCDCGHVSGL